MYLGACMSNAYDVNEWEARNKITGEVIELDALHVMGGGHWEKVYIDELARMIGLTISDSSAAVLSYLIKSKDSKNQILGTQREIAGILKVNLSTVSRVIKKLESNGFLKQIRSGLYLLNPRIMHFGSVGNQHAILKIWSKS
jgi:hypothetical protein